MRIETQADVDYVNAKFGHFHDGLLKQVRFVSNSMIHANLPWDEQRGFATNEEELEAAGTLISDDYSIELDIHFPYYDMPNQPMRRAILIRACDVEIHGDLTSFLGYPMSDLAFSRVSERVVLTLINANPWIAGVSQFDENAAKVRIDARKVFLEETMWREGQYEGFE